MQEGSMAVNLKGRSFLTLMDFSPEEVRYLLDLSRDLKAKKRMGVFNHLLKGKNIVLLFEKASTRPRRRRACSPGNEMPQRMRRGWAFASALPMPRNTWTPSATASC
jgi:hypothetical protein